MNLVSGKLYRIQEGYPLGRAYFSLQAEPGKDTRKLIALPRGQILMFVDKEITKNDSTSDYYYYRFLCCPFGVVSRKVHKVYLERWDALLEKIGS